MSQIESTVKASISDGKNSTFGYSDESTRYFVHCLKSQDFFFGLAGFYDGKQSETSLGGKTNSWLIYDLESYSSCRLVSNIHCNDAISQESLLFNTPDHRDRRRRDGYTLVES